MRTVPLRCATGMQQEIMERTHKDIELRLRNARTLKAADDPVIERKGPHKGWDPFEIWRTRVRAMQRTPPTEGKDIKG